MTNTERASFGHDAVEAGTPDARENDEFTNLVDTLANVMHYARHESLDFDEALRWARDHVDAEVLDV